MRRQTTRLALPAVLVAALLAAGCGEGRNAGEGAAANAAGGSGSDLSGRIQSDGSSTVGPLTTAAAERFQRQHPGVQVAVGISGTGGGFERFCAGETDISNASREIKEEELAACEEAGITPIGFRVATDAITVVANPQADWLDCLTVEQLEAIWKPGSDIDDWSEVPGGDFPDEKLALFGPGTDSGTFDYFTDAINGEEGASRSDYQASEDDNVTVQGVSGSRGGLGYFGFSYYDENADQLQAVAIDSGEGCVEPSVEAAQSGEYAPLARPLFVYVSRKSLERPEVAEFVRFYLDNAIEIAQDALFIPLTDEEKQEALAQLEQATGA